MEKENTSLIISNPYGKPLASITLLRDIYFKKIMLEAMLKVMWDYGYPPKDREENHE